jgi:uncharacterized SAM-binding protein YcdF (DUF218 family)
MFEISKIINYLILPPGIFILLLLILSLLLVKKYLKSAKFLCWFTIIFIYLLSIKPVMNALLQPLEKRYSAITLNRNIKEIDYIVILGGGINSNSPDENGYGSLSPTALKRVIYGTRVYYKTPKPIIVSGGRVFQDNNVETEATIAKKLLIELKIPANKIFLEEKSRNTWENALFVKKKFNPKKILLVTSAFHMQRSIYCFKQQNINCIPAPTGHIVSQNDYNFTSFLPRANSLMGSYLALKEYLGYLYYMMRY